MKFWLICQGSADAGILQGKWDGEHSRLRTYRKDGDDDPHGAEHCIIYCLTSFQRILDAVIVAVEPSVVRLDGAGLNDQEGQARWSGWNHRTYQEKQNKTRGKHQCNVVQEWLQQRPPQMTTLTVILTPWELPLHTSPLLLSSSLVSKGTGEGRGRARAARPHCSTASC